jgi:hypothetical protein
VHPEITTIGYEFLTQEELNNMRNNKITTYVELPRRSLFDVELGFEIRSKMAEISTLNLLLGKEFRRSNRPTVPLATKLANLALNKRLLNPGTVRPDTKVYIIDCHFMIDRPDLPRIAATSSTGKYLEARINPNSGAFSEVDTALIVSITNPLIASKVGTTEEPTFVDSNLLHANQSKIPGRDGRFAINSGTRIFGL